MTTLRHDVVFRVDDQPVAAWWYPAGDEDIPGPALVMAHGFGMTRHCLLDRYAEAFQAAGFACLVFDHRGFGDSGGEAQVLDLAQQRRDWKAAVAWCRANPAVDEAKVCLWGTSFSGGHVLHTAARDARLAAAVIQVPYVDGPSSLQVSDVPEGGPPVERQPGPAPTKADWIKHGATLMANAVADAAGAKLGRGPRLVPIAGPLGSGAVISGPGALEGLSKLVPEGVVWRNEVAPRVVLEMATDRPMKDASRIVAPLLVCVCTYDRVTPTAPAKQVAADAPRGELREYATDHMDAYQPPWRDQLIADQIAFLRQHTSD